MPNPTHATASALNPDTSCGRNHRIRVRTRVPWPPQALPRAFEIPMLTAERLAAGHGLVAESERGLVGTVVVRPPQPTSSAALYRDPDTWSVGQLAVLPEWKGRGLGRALHDAAVD
ncbi:MAG: GNAT family N-acetyltransferase, partial [Betaproteobacteria bacterium]